MPENQTDTNLIKNTSVLITGGSGLVGKYLTSLLLGKGYRVSHLSRNANQFGKVRVYRWDPGKEIIDPAVFQSVDFIIHLTGANIGEKRWTKNRKADIIKSRVESSLFLHKVITDNEIRLKAFISASATGYYGTVTSDKIYSEEDPPSNDFTGSLCRQWEQAVDLFGKDGIRTVKIRTAVVLAKNDSALSKLMVSAKYGFLMIMGNGRQHIPWIHIKDLCNIYLKAIEDSGISGAYNAVAPQHVTYTDFIKTLANIIKRIVLPLPVPAIILKAVKGEMSDIILKGSRVSSKKITDAGYQFAFKSLYDALNNILSD